MAEPVRSTAVNGDARPVFVPVIQSPNAAPADFVDGTRRAA
jgi:hypothetical protein